MTDTSLSAALGKSLGLTPTATDSFRQVVTLERTAGETITAQVAQNDYARAMATLNSWPWPLHDEGRRHTVNNQLEPLTLRRWATGLLRDPIDRHLADFTVLAGLYENHAKPARMFANIATDFARSWRDLGHMEDVARLQAQVDRMSPNDRAGNEITEDVNKLVARTVTVEYAPHKQITAFYDPDAQNGNKVGIGWSMSRDKKPSEYIRYEVFWLQGQLNIVGHEYDNRSPLAVSHSQPVLATVQALVQLHGKASAEGVMAGEVKQAIWQARDAVEEAKFGGRRNRRMLLTPETVQETRRLTQSFLEGRPPRRHPASSKQPERA